MPDWELLVEEGSWATPGSLIFPEVFAEVLGLPESEKKLK